MDGTTMCNGTCNGSTDAGGNCTGSCDSDMSAGGTCEGTCDGTCSGSCTAEVTADGSCTGQCKGECEYTPPMGMCDASAQAKCEASAGAMVTCDGKCEGEVEPPSAKAECQASAKAEAKADVTCTPPTIALDYTFQAGGQFQSEAELEAFLNVFFDSYAELLAQGALVTELQGAVQGLAGAVGTVTGELQDQASAAGEGDLLLAAQLQCGITGLGMVPALLTDSGNMLAGSAMVVTSMTTEFASGI
jgi:hypothetical protein